MYLFQKLKYKYKHIESFSDLKDMLTKLSSSDATFCCIDTETDGLNIITSKPFLFSLCFDKYTYTFDYDGNFINEILRVLENKNIMVFAHNAKFDYHMILNGGNNISPKVKIMDSITIARLTEYADSIESMSLENLGSKYVDEESKFAGKVIKTLIIKENKIRRDNLKAKLIDRFPDMGLSRTTPTGVVKPTGKLTELIKEYDKSRVKFVNDDDEVYKFIDENFTEANYKDIYEKEPELMRCYAADDVVILNEYITKAMPSLEKVDVNLRVMRREGLLIPTVAKMERNGLLVDIPYILESRKQVKEYQELLYFELSMYTGEDFSIGQHEVIKKIFKKNFSISMEKCDEKALTYVADNCNDETAITVARTILELRTIDKWLSTYIDGKLNSIIDGRIYTDINNNGAVSGRVSCNMQQQPKEGLKDRDGNELFHPRRMFICDPGYDFFFIDESQMELRIQAYYTMLVGNPDINLCRAYMPYKCYNNNSTVFDPNNREMIMTFRQKEWFVNDTGEKWTPTDLHSETTKHAFPNVDPASPEFKKYRKLGKQCNFLKVYQGGVEAIISEIGVDRDTAMALDQAFYKAFPNIKTYQEWVSNQLSEYGYVENLYGRRYYMKDPKWFYKGCNYLIQGTCADMVKTFEILIDRFLIENKSSIKMVLPVHDEIIFLVPKRERHNIKRLKAIMEDTLDVVKTIPMIAEVEYSESNWRDKKAYEVN